MKTKTLLSIALTLFFYGTYGQSGQENKLSSERLVKTFLIDEDIDGLGDMLDDEFDIPLA